MFLPYHQARIKCTFASLKQSGAILERSHQHFAFLSTQDSALFSGETVGALRRLRLGVKISFG